MLKVVIISKGSNPKQHIQRLSKRLQLVGQSEIFDAAEQTTEEIKTYIGASKVRPPKAGDALVNSINHESINSTGGVSGGIGNISDLKDKAPHFELIDAGGTYETKNTFVPPPFEDGEFRTFKAGSKHTITGIAYIDYGMEIFADLLKKAIDILNQEFKI